MTSAPRLASSSLRAMPRKVNFTRETLSTITCPPGKKLVHVWDSKTPGLQFVVRATGVKNFYWYGRVRNELRPVRHYIGPEQLPIEQARKLALAATLKAKQGENPNSAGRLQREMTRTAITVGNCWQEYRRTFLDVKAKLKTKRTHESLWNVWLAHLAATSVRDLERKNMEDLHRHIAAGRTRPAGEKTGRGNNYERKLGGERTANKAIALLRAIFNKADLKSHPLDDRKLSFFKQHSRERYLEPDELHRFLVALEQEHDHASRDFIKLALFTGARRSTVQSMRWDEIDFSARRWSIPSHKTKAGKPIEVPLVAPALAVLESRRALDDSGDFVFANTRSASGHLQEPRYAFQRVCKAAGIKNLRMHDLRRTAGSWLTAAGANSTVVGKALGHAAGSPATSIYSRINLDPVRKALDTSVANMLAAGVMPVTAAKKKQKKGSRRRA